MATGFDCPHQPHDNARHPGTRPARRLDRPARTRHHRPDRRDRRPRPAHRRHRTDRQPTVTSMASARLRTRRGIQVHDENRETIILRGNDSDSQGCLLSLTMAFPGCSNRNSPVIASHPRLSATALVSSRAVRPCRPVGRAWAAGCPSFSHVHALSEHSNCSMPYTSSTRLVLSGGSVNVTAPMISNAMARGMITQSAMLSQSRPFHAYRERHITAISTITADAPAARRMKPGFPQMCSYPMSITADCLLSLASRPDRWRPTGLPSSHPASHTGRRR